MESDLVILAIYLMTNGTERRLDPLMFLAAHICAWVGHLPDDEWYSSRVVLSHFTSKSLYVHMFFIYYRDLRPSVRLRLDPTSTSLDGENLHTQYHHIFSCTLNQSTLAVSHHQTYTVRVRTTHSLVKISCKINIKLVQKGKGPTQKEKNKVQKKGKKSKY